MKQVVQNLRSGVLETLDVPCPQVARGHVLIQSRATLISAGTERSLVEFGRASLVSKARQNPERVRQVWQKIKTDGFWSTLDAVFARLDEPMPLGYCNAGVAVDIGPDVTQFNLGDRIVSNGNHAEMVHRPVNLCAKIPANVTDEQASFAVLGAIGLQGIRLLQPGIGESVAVFGLGLIGLLTVQMLVNSGVRVLGIDPDPRRLALAAGFGATTVDLSADADPVAAGLAFSGGHGVDGVLITASAKRDKIVSQSAQMSRKRGKVILVGVVDLDLQRAEFYQKELTFQVSCSYGPGRYDTNYEQAGNDYPYPYVRWTEQRNIEAILQMLAVGRLNVAPLITGRLAHSDAQRAYELLTTDRTQLGIVLNYPTGEAPREAIVEVAANGHAGSATTVGSSNGSQLSNGATRLTDKAKTASNAASTSVRRPGVGIIGSGSFATNVLIPLLRKQSVELVSVASANGLSGAHAARKFGFARSTTDYRTIIDDPAIEAVFITTRPVSHPGMVAEALSAGKHVFVEKPLAIDRAGLRTVCEAYDRAHDRQLLVGFNRRFSPQAIQMQKLLAGRSLPACLSMLVNAGHIAPDHWTQDPAINGGRIIGEGCHWFDLMSYLVQSPIVSVHASTVGSNRAATAKLTEVPTQADQISITLTFADGSIGTLHYFANGHRGFPKETLHVFCEGRVLELNNFRRLQGYGWSKFSKLNLFRQDKGYANEFASFIESVSTGGSPLIPFDSIVNVTEAAFAAMESVGHGRTVPV